jgi:hypothetical protein
LRALTVSLMRKKGEVFTRIYVIILLSRVGIRRLEVHYQFLINVIGQVFILYPCLSHVYLLSYQHAPLVTSVTKLCKVTKMCTIAVPRKIEFAISQEWCEGDTIHM